MAGLLVGTPRRGVVLAGRDAEVAEGVALEGVAEVEDRGEGVGELEDAGCGYDGG